MNSAWIDVHDEPLPNNEMVVGWYHSDYVFVMSMSGVDFYHNGHDWVPLESSFLTHYLYLPYPPK